MSKLTESDKYKHCNHHHELTENQEIVVIGGDEFVADKEMIPLLRALNDAGIKTTSHCCGHETNRPFIRISTKNIEFIDLRQYEGSAVICWRKPEDKKPMCWRERCHEFWFGKGCSGCELAGEKLSESNE
ncbi:MAG: hypothetical protein PVG39_02215 [Desulfobacteraceae bacterium]|jgi:hypothetical protein